ncbi:uncharacterized protein LOC116261285 [Nymphaea colorata]|uniref:Uncharacterized protein n=1 Tax=Nymphaea colorata TaxID=210225 RepID=A0A5K1GHY0_9MAGN|nr:uncharacterized protein LOC116261285 [Nymphaea colorata]XP_031495836.1 uncharacterized protein LOC116261285 [Nymphaea colorata]
MADPYERAKGGKLTFKGGGDPLEEKRRKKKKQKLKRKKKEEGEEEDGGEGGGEGGEGVGEEAKEMGSELYTIDAAKRLKYDQLFPVEAKKFGYGDPSQNPRSVEEALDDRVKKKADRYCK